MQGMCAVTGQSVAARSPGLGLWERANFYSQSTSNNDSMQDETSDPLATGGAALGNYPPAKHVVYTESRLQLTQFCTQRRCTLLDNGIRRVVTEADSVDVVVH